MVILAVEYLIKIVCTNKKNPDNLELSNFAEDQRSLRLGVQKYFKSKKGLIALCETFIKGPSN